LFGTFTIIAVESIERQQKEHWFWGIGIARSPGGILEGLLELLQMFMGMLKRVRNVANEHAD